VGAGKSPRKPYRRSTKLDADGASLSGQNLHPKDFGPGISEIYGLARHCCKAAQGKHGNSHVFHSDFKNATPKDQTDAASKTRRLTVSSGICHRGRRTEYVECREETGTHAIRDIAKHSLGGKQFWRSANQ
jgi:hypothetical protein